MATKTFTGPRGGRGYFTSTGTKVYGAPPAGPLASAHEAHAAALIGQNRRFHTDPVVRDGVERAYWSRHPPEVRKAAALLLRGWISASTGEAGAALAHALREAGIVKHAAPSPVEDSNSISRFSQRHNIPKAAVLEAVRAQYAYTQAYLKTKPAKSDSMAVARVINPYPSKGQVGFDRTIQSASSVYHTYNRRPVTDQTHAAAVVRAADVYATHRASAALRQRGESEVVVMYSPGTKSSLHAYKPHAPATPAKETSGQASNTRNDGGIFDDF